MAWPLAGRAVLLSQRRCLERTLGNAERLLRVDEDFVPEVGLFRAFQLRQIEIGAAALGEQRLGVVEEEEAEIEQAARHRRAVDEEVSLRQVPAARPHLEHGGLGIERVVLAVRRIVEADRPRYGVAQIELTLDEIGPARRRGVL